MSEDPQFDTVVETAPFLEEGNGPSNSLADRMKKRAATLEKEQADWFPIPGFDDLLEVELRALGYQTIRRVQRRNEKIRDQTVMELYNMADQLLTATQGFRQVNEPSSLEGETWVSLARRLDNCPPDLTPRQALLFLVGEKRIMFLVQDWAEWARTVRDDVDGEVVRDFDRTG